jgi:hypothetical protein
MATLQKRIYDKILVASSVIQQRGQRGPATFAVVNILKNLHKIVKYNGV